MRRIACLAIILFALVHLSSSSFSITPLQTPTLHFAAWAELICDERFASLAEISIVTNATEQHYFHLKAATFIAFSSNGHAVTPFPPQPSPFSDGKAHLEPQLALGHLSTLAFALNITAEADQFSSANLSTIIQTSSATINLVFELTGSSQTETVSIDFPLVAFFGYQPQQQLELYPNEQLMNQLSVVSPAALGSFSRSLPSSNRLKWSILIPQLDSSVRSPEYLTLELVGPFAWSTSSSLSADSNANDINHDPTSALKDVHTVSCLVNGIPINGEIDTTKQRLTLTLIDLFYNRPLVWAGGAFSLDCSDAALIPTISWSPLQFQLPFYAALTFTANDGSFAQRQEVIDVRIAPLIPTSYVPLPDSISAFVHIENKHLIASQTYIFPSAVSSQSVSTSKLSKSKLLALLASPSSSSSSSSSSSVSTPEHMLTVGDNAPGHLAEPYESIVSSFSNLQLQSDIDRYLFPYFRPYDVRTWMMQRHTSITPSKNTSVSITQNVNQVFEPRLSGVKSFLSQQYTTHNASALTTDHPPVYFQYRSQAPSLHDPTQIQPVFVAVAPNARRLQPVAQELIFDEGERPFKFNLYNVQTDFDVLVLAFPRQAYQFSGDFSNCDISVLRHGSQLSYTLSLYDSNGHSSGHMFDLTLSLADLKTNFALHDDIFITCPHGSTQYRPKEAAMGTEIISVSAKMAQNAGVHSFQTSLQFTPREFIFSVVLVIIIAFLFVALIIAFILVRFFTFGMSCVQKRKSKKQLLQQEASQQDADAVTIDALSPKPPDASVNTQPDQNQQQSSPQNKPLYSDVVVPAQVNANVYSINSSEPESHQPLLSNTDIC